MTTRKIRPAWTVVTNLMSPESGEWVGTSWEFFNTEEQAYRCYGRHLDLGNVPTKRPYHDGRDWQHLGAVHQAAEEAHGA